jgi:hypothetical protein
VRSQTLKAEVWSAKKKLMDLWDFKGVTDQEILEAAAEVDRLLNEHYRTKEDKPDHFKNPDN